MKAIFADCPGASLVVRETATPQPGAGEVLVKITAAPINPSDIAGIKRGRPGNPAPFIPGLEGAGTVVAAGKGLLPRLWLGKRVTCSPMQGYGGTWAEYMVTGATHCFPLGKKVTDEQGSMSLVNPLTALGFIEIAQKGKHSAIINNAAASALGRMLELLCRKNTISLINIVRSYEQVEYLERSGSRHVLNSSDPLFPDQLSSLAKELNASLLFDSVCGEGLHTLIEALPHGSIAVIYGNLSTDDYASISPRFILGNDITITGFYLGNVTKQNGLIRNMLNLIMVRKLMSSDLKINIRSRFPLHKAQEAIDSYLANMSAGKVLLIP